MKKIRALRRRSATKAFSNEDRRSQPGLDASSQESAPECGTKIQSRDDGNELIPPGLSPVRGYPPTVGCGGGIPSSGGGGILFLEKAHVGAGAVAVVEARTLLRSSLMGTQAHLLHPAAERHLL